MPYKLELINVLSYDGVVHATSRHPFVEVADLQTAQQIEGTGYFKLLSADKDSEGGLYDNDPLSNYTEEELNKMNKADHEAIILKLNGDPSTSKNAAERIELILSIQEELDQLEAE